MIHPLAIAGGSDMIHPLVIAGGSDQPDFRWRIAITKIVQKIDTGGTSNTSTPMLKFLMKVLFDPNDARHMTHCAKAESDASKEQSATSKTSAKMRMVDSDLINHIFFLQ